jgi:biopolymer transport protein ExbD
MKIRRTGSLSPERVELNMTPMIDVVFQLLAFFMFTLKISTVEGNFDIKMPSAAKSMVESLEAPPSLKVRLVAKPDGSLAQIVYNDRPLRDFAALRSQIIAFVGNDQAAKKSAEVEIDADYQLHYKYVIDAITHVSGYLVDDGQTRVNLVEKIKFTQPKPPGNSP